MPHTLRGPAQRRQRVARGGGLHQAFQIGQKPRIVDEGLLAAATRLPDATRTQAPPGRQFLEPALNRRVTDPRRPHHARDTASPRRPGLGGGPDPSPALREGRRQCPVLHATGLDIHALRLLLPVVNSCSDCLTLPKLPGTLSVPSHSYYPTGQAP